MGLGEVAVGEIFSAVVGQHALPASFISAADLGKYSYNENAKSSQRNPITSALSWAKTEELTSNFGRPLAFTATATNTASDLTCSALPGRPLR